MIHVSTVAMALAAVLVLCPAPANPAGGQDGGASVQGLSGVWDFSGGCTSEGVRCPFMPSDVPLKARALGFMAAWDEAAGPKYDCVPATVPSLVADPYSFEIRQLEDRVVLIYEKDDIVRTVWLEGHGHQEPGVYDFTVQGHSIGRYEGEQLVVETNQFTFDPHGLDDRSNMPSSTRKSVTERYWLEDGRLKAEVTTEDPIFLTGPVRFYIAWERGEGPLVLPYACLPELARQPTQFLPSKYRDPGWIELPVPPDIVP